ncbi:MAG: hypothetical protein EBZ48_09665, partial [Proteobacteria bacterium]|nr:hypothetical protein [Pseudomonadota bacterium]
MNADVCADIETSSSGYRERFSGAAGRWLLGVQSRIFIEQLSSGESIQVVLLAGCHHILVEHGGEYL